MIACWWIARREFASFFRVPLGWVVWALFLLLSGVIFAQTALRPGGPATMRPFFDLWWGLLLIIAPAISMRVLSEEWRTGTIEPLMTSPASELAVVAGKFMGAGGFLLVTLAPTLAYAGLLLALSRPDPGPMLSGYLGVVLLGGLYLSVGVLMSALTSSQTLAFLSTLMALTLTEAAARAGAAGRVPPPWDGVLASMSPTAPLGDFSRGVIDTGHVVWYVTVTGWMLAMSALALRVRRWR